MWMSHEIYAAFAKRLVQLCENNNLPPRGRQAEIARICGIKPSSVNKWFNAQSLPDAYNLLKLAEWGKTTVDFLLSGKEPKIEHYAQDPRIEHILKIAEHMTEYQLNQAVTILDTIAQPAPNGHDAPGDKAA